MWRAGLIKTSSALLERRILQNSRRYYSGGSGGGGAAKAILWTTGAVSVGTSSALAYAYYDPEFRKNIEKNVPVSKDILNTILGDPRDTSKPLIELPNVKEIGDKISSVMPARKDEKAPPSSSHEQPMTETQSVPKATKKETTPQKSSETKDEAKKEAELVKRVKERDEAVERAKKKLEQMLQPLMTRVEEATKTAIDAKLKAVMMIDLHTKRVRKAMEDMKAEKDDSEWRAVNETYEGLKQSLKLDESNDAEARAHLDRLRKAINESLASKDTGDHPLLTQASEALNKWNYQLNEATSRVKQAQTEHRITNDFKKLIEEGREQFAKELESILPNVDIHAKGKKLTEDELNALIAHAHIRVDQLRRQLAEQQLREQQHIEQALQRQRAELSRLANDKVEKELANRGDEQDVQIRVKLQEAREEFEEELRKQMRRQAAAHSEHLEDVVKSQKARQEREAERELNEALLKERNRFNCEVATAIARLRAIEDALEGRAEQDSENRRSKELWLACQHLKKAVLLGRADGRDYNSRKKPLVKEITAVKQAGVADPFVKILVTGIKSEAVSQGVFTQDDLVDRFQRVKNACRRTAMIGENGGTLFQYFTSYLQSFFLFDRVKPTSKDLEQVDLSKIDTLGVLWRASHFVDQLDFESAIKLMLLLKGEPARVASDWINDARLHLETRRTAELLLAHASAVTMRTIY